VHYDRQGIYGHVDHVQVHRAGAAAAARLGVTGYEATVDGGALRRLSAGGYEHVLHAAAGHEAEVGVPGGAISLAVRATPQGLAAKRAAMAAHASQIGPAYLAEAGFAGGYGREWFVRRGAPGLLESVLG
jgi:LmbE family N-acetylglucosaminyl deacetylase